MFGLFINTEEIVSGNQHHGTDAVHKNISENSCRTRHMKSSKIKSEDTTLQIVDCCAETEEQAIKFLSVTLACHFATDRFMLLSCDETGM